jgi:DNA repair protein RecO (recombination protein O)
MLRTFTYSALVLRVRPVGESNREVTFLTAEEGIIRATVFGGPKSKLRAHTAPYHQGTVWIYRDPAKDFFKVTDFDVRFWRPGLRERYERAMAAAAVAETILAAHGGGGAWSDALTLAAATLDALETADEGAGRRMVIHFLWNWADILGFRPDLTRCASCGKIYAGENGVVWYSRREGSIICPACAGLSADEAALVAPDLAADFLPVGPGTRRWFATAENLRAAMLTRFTMDKASEAEAKALATAVLAGALGKRLSTWDGV